MMKKGVADDDDDDDEWEPVVRPNLGDDDWTFKNLNYKLNYTGPFSKRYTWGMTTEL